MLDNPLWSSLSTMHASLRVGDGSLARYPADVAPFVAWDGTGRADVASLVRADESVHFIGPHPALPAGWQLEDHGAILQMVCERVPAVPAGEPIVPARLDDVRGLAALVYPHYFRARTPELGRYAGIYDGDRLAAMVGERMGFPGWREISAVCTHPEYVGRGLARRLLAHLGADIEAGGATPFLHVSPANTRAVALYEQNGYRVRKNIPFVSIHGPLVRR